MGKLVINGFEARENVVEAPPSKAFTLRYLLASALSRTWVNLRKLNWGDDTWAMIRGVKPITEMEIKGDLIRVRRGLSPERFRVIDVGESGFTLRTLTGIYAGIDGVTLLMPRGSLLGRPMDELITALKSLNARVDRSGGVVRIVGGRLVGGYVSISGSVSSQFISSLLYLAPLTESGIEVNIRPPVKSRPYIDATISVLRDFGISVEVEDSAIYVDGSQEFRATNDEVVVPGDYALSAFYMVLSALSGLDLRITNLTRGRAVEGEYVFITHARKMGVDIEEGSDYVLVRGSRTRELSPLEVDLSDSPDIAMPLALLMARARGKSRIMGVGHLTHKESNRLRGIAGVLKCLGAGVSVDETSGIIEIEGTEEFRGGCEIETQGDHRIVMMSVVGGLLARERVVVNDWEGVSKSWPTFTWDLERLGARIHYL